MNSSDPFGLCDPPKDPCVVYITAFGQAHGASLSTLQPEAMGGYKRSQIDQGTTSG